MIEEKVEFKTDDEEGFQLSKFGQVDEIEEIYQSKEQQMIDKSNSFFAS